MEGHAILPNGQPAEGMLLELKRDEKKMDSIVMNNLGYWQFKARFVSIKAIILVD